MKTRIISLPDTVFLRGKVIVLYREAGKKAASGTLAVVERSRVLSTSSKVQTIVNCQRRSGGESIEAWPSTGRSLQDISDMPLRLRKKCSLNIHLEVLRIGKHGRVFHVMLRVHGGGSDCGSSDRKWWLGSRFLHGAEETLLSCYREK